MYTVHVFTKFGSKYMFINHWLKESNDLNISIDDGTGFNMVKKDLRRGGIIKFA
jgi:hypothetical protein